MCFYQWNLFHTVYKVYYFSDIKSEICSCTYSSFLPLVVFLWGSGNISIDLYFPKKWNKNCTDFRADPMCTSNINALGDSFWLDHFQTCPTFHLFWLKLVSVQYLIPYLFMCVNTFHQDFVPMDQFFDHHVFIRKKKGWKSTIKLLVCEIHSDETWILLWELQSIILWHP